MLVFPETFIPTYPYWIRDLIQRQPCYEVFVQYFRNSISVPSKETEKLALAAKKANTWVVIGISEQGGGTIYNSNLYLSNKGEVLGTHRKLLPTFTERAIWGWGDGSTLHVFDTEIGKIGSLVCYEHHMPLIKFAMFSKGEQIHGACWPGLKIATHIIDAANRQYAFEGQVFVLASAAVQTEGMIPRDFPLKDHIMPAHGGSSIVDPFGLYLAGPVYDREEILYADIDLDRILQAKYVVDSVGHYSRPEVAQLLLNEGKFKTVVKNSKAFMGEEIHLESLDGNITRLNEQIKNLVWTLNKLQREDILNSVDPKN